MRSVCIESNFTDKKVHSAFQLAQHAVKPTLQRRSDVAWLTWSAPNFPCT